MSENWIIKEDNYSPSEIPKYETLFALGNGFLGIRGCFEEHSGVYKPGTFINGFFETEPIVYGEHAYGYAKNRQKMIPLTEGTKIQVFADGEQFTMDSGRVRDYSRVLNMRTGILTRELHWKSPAGKEFFLRFSRLVSSVHPHTAAFRVSVTPDSPCSLRFVSGIFNRQLQPEETFDPRVGGFLRKTPLALVRKKIDPGLGSLRFRTRNSGLSYVCAMTHSIQNRPSAAALPELEEYEVRHSYEIDAAGGEEVVLEKYLSYFTTLETAQSDLSKAASDAAVFARERGFESLAAEKEAYLSGFWSGADIEIESGENLQESIRFNMYHLLQAAGKWGDGNIPAKGLTGEGYEGHYFWDTEIYLLPFFLYTVPEVARSLLMYRYKILPAARQRARELHHKGALYPWRTINGEEASPYYPAGTAQYHINADIAYSCRRYWKISGDDEFLLDYGAEMLFETARFWSDFADYIPDKGYCFNCVTGPDEYTALVNNNAYTNYMARENLNCAAEAADFMKENYPKRYDRLKGRISLQEEEIEAWRKVEASIYFPCDEKRGLIPQDDSFFEKAVWDFDSTPENARPLLLHYHPLTIYRYQVLKQPDLLLAFFLLSAQFSPEEKSANFDYYDPLTTGDSSLSSCIQSIIATEVGKIEKGEEYFLKTARMDLDDINKNVKDGIHAAAMGGTWLTLIYGFAGLRDDGERIGFRPALPKSIGKLSFTLQIRKQILAVTVFHDRVSYRLGSGERLSIDHFGEKIDLIPEKTLTMHIYAH